MEGLWRVSMLGVVSSDGRSIVLELALGNGLRGPEINLLLSSASNNSKSIIANIASIYMPRALFLQRYSKTLQSLELSNITFANIKDEAGNFVTPDSWISFILFLGHHMSLQHIRFDGTSTNEWDESWKTHDFTWHRNQNGIDIPAGDPNHRLRYEIERFIKNGEPAPFIPCERLKDYTEEDDDY